MSLIRIDSNSNVFVNVPYFNGITHRIRGANGLRCWSPIQVPTTICCVCCVKVCVHVLLCLVFVIAVYLGNKVIFYQLSMLTSLVTVNSCNATCTDHFKFLRARDCIDSRNESLKYRRRWVRTSHQLRCRRVL